MSNNVKLKVFSDNRCTSELNRYVKSQSFCILQSLCDVTEGSAAFRKLLSPPLRPFLSPYQSEERPSACFNLVVCCLFLFRTIIHGQLLHWSPRWKTKICKHKLGCRTVQRSVEPRRAIPIWRNHRTFFIFHSPPFFSLYLKACKSVATSKWHPLQATILSDAQMPNRHCTPARKPKSQNKAIQKTKQKKTNINRSAWRFTFQEVARWGFQQFSFQPAICGQPFTKKTKRVRVCERERNKERDGG